MRKVHPNGEDMAAKKSDLFPVGAQASQHMVALLQCEEGYGPAETEWKPLSAHFYFVVSCCECQTTSARPCPIVCVINALQSLQSVHDPAFGVESLSPRLGLQPPVTANYI